MRLLGGLRIFKQKNIKVCFGFFELIKIIIAKNNFFKRTCPVFFLVDNIKKKGRAVLYSFFKK